MILIFGNSPRLITKGFGFSIPLTDIIDGISVTIEKSRSSFLAVYAVDVEVNLTKDGGMLFSVNKAAGNDWPTSDAPISYGGPADLWGSTWTPGEINNPNFGLGIIVNAAAEVRIDHITITVYHHTPFVPITLSSFDAVVTNTNTVQLDWTTASEINNDFFTVEKSVDGESYVAMAEVKGSGNTNTTRRYHYEDRQPYAGRNYYRLKQTDFDGTYSYSKVVKVDYDGPAHPVLVLRPNPTRGNSVRFRVVGLSDTGSVHMAVYDLQGRILAEQKYVVNHRGVIEDELELDSPLSAGLYIVKAGSGLQMTRKLVVRR